LGSFPLFVVSPHFDDAVFGCATLLSRARGSIVCTVFAGTPPQSGLTDWDRQCGFADASHAMQARAAEDRQALYLLGAAQYLLPFLDAQYGPEAAVESIAGALHSAFTTAMAGSGHRAGHQAGAILIPLGLFHSDHILVHHACRIAAARHPRVPCLAYEDALYRRMPGLLQQRLAALDRAGIDATPADAPLVGSSDATATGAAAASLADAARKRAAVLAYASQLNAFGAHGYEDVFAPERYWRLEWRTAAGQR
jgi:LmbE family N-acetylglucosaminyl deacetylase